MSGPFGRRAGQAIGRSAGDARGAIAVMTAMLLPVLIGIAAWAIDASLLLYRQERLQLAADIGALGGGQLLLSGATEAQAIAFAQRLTTANVGSGSAATVTAEFPEPDRLELDASQPVPRIFSQIFGTGDFTIRAATVAEIVYGVPAAPDACLYLDDDSTTNRALHLNRSSTAVLEGCAAVVASTHPRRAVALDRRASLEVGCLDVAGGIDAQVTTTLPGCPRPRTGVDPLPPKPVFPAFDDVDPPRPTGPCAPEKEYDKVRKDKDKKKTGKKNETDNEGKDSDPVQLKLYGPLLDGLKQIRFCNKLKIERDTEGEPGVFFFEKELEIKDDATLMLDRGAIIILMDDLKIESGSTLKIGHDAIIFLMEDLKIKNGAALQIDPGAIIILMDDLKIEEGATLTLGLSEDDRESEKGAIIVLMDEAEIDMDDDATLEITAPNDGKWKGIAIIAGPDRDDPDDRRHKLTGLKIDGALVLPGEEIELDGISTGAPCMPILAGTLELKDDARLEMRCSGGGGGGGGRTEGTVRLLPTP